jgi:hypothetical protein
LEQICLAFSCVCLFQLWVFPLSKQLQKKLEFKTFLPRRIQSAVLDDVDIAPRIHFLLPKLSLGVCRLQEIGHCCPDFRSQWKIVSIVVQTSDLSGRLYMRRIQTFISLPTRTADSNQLQISVKNCVLGGFRPSNFNTNQQ